MSYLRDERIDSTLPSIRSSVRAWEAPPRPRVTPVDDRDVVFEDRVKYGPNAYRDREIFYPRPPSPSHRRHMPTTESSLAEQLKFYKDEIAKKDRLISQITSMETPRPRIFDTSKIDELYSPEKAGVVAALRSEVAALQVRCEGLQSQLHEAQAQVEVREDRIKELKLQVETSRENESRQMALCTSLRAKIAEYEAQAGSLEGAASRSEMAIHSLQRECSNYQERVLELEQRLKQQLENREAAEQEKIMSERRYTELVSQIQKLCHIDGYTNYDIPPDAIAATLNDIISENVMLRGKIATLREHCQSAELESKASRETIMRLVSEAEREQRTTGKYSMELDKYKMERNDAVERQRELEHEISMLRDRLEASQRAWSATKHELDEREARFSSADRENRDRTMMIRNVESKYITFKDTLANILSDNFHAIEPNEEIIRDRVSNIVLQLSDKTAHLDMLEAKVGDLTKQLDIEMNNNRNSELKIKRLEGDVLELQQQLRKYENELASADMLRDGLRIDKDRYMRFLERIVYAMKMEAITMDLGVESITDAIIARAEQLTKMESDNLIDRKTHIYNLQRKVKSQKDQLESKELHMELLRKKVAALEERLSGQTEYQREKEEGVMKSRKLAKLVERYKLELNEARLEIRDLKARLLESSDIHARTLHQEREIEELEAKVGQLETVRQRQASKLSGLKENFSETLNQFESKKSQTHSTIQALSSELRTTKQSLEEVIKREKALLDLRQVIARMLGLDVTSLAVPDYEIIARLEKLILANQANASSAIALDTALLDMEDGFRAGYNDASRALAAVGTNTRRNMKRGTSLRTRPRSASPGRRQRDTRAY